ncbi:reverse transcriptase domain-containing protein [Tanacetum coccineum]
MPPRRAPVAKRAPVARRTPSARTANNPARNASTPTDAPMSAVAINQLIETRVAEALTNQEQLRNSGVNGDGNVMSARPKTMQEAIELANDLMDQKVRSYAERQAENKRKFDSNNQAQQQLPKMQNYANCKKVGHLTRDCWNLTTANNQRTITCYECENQGHYRSDCPELRNRNHGNQAENTKAHGVVYALGGEEIDQDPNNIEDEIEAQEEDFLASTSEP